MDIQTRIERVWKVLDFFDSNWVLCSYYTFESDENKKKIVFGTIKKRVFSSDSF